jgi:outer membrane scaffolding protein for murein synthesis (MipA/OmpV family)
MFRPQTTAAALILSLGATTAPALAQSASDNASDWKVSLGAGAIVQPEYPGSDEMKIMPIPDFDVTWRNRVFLNMQNGLGVYALKSDTATLGASVGVHFGRDEDDGDRLNGMGDIDTTAQAKLFGSYNFGWVEFGGELGRDLGEGDGFSLDVNAAYPMKLTPQWRVNPAIGATFADDDYMQSWFGVTSPQAARSGLATYEADGGLMSTYAKVDVQYFVTEKWILGSSFKVERLMGDAADSPVVEEKTQPSVLFSVSRRF